MRIYAKQVPPEYQESPFSFCDWPAMWPGVIIHGNHNYNSYTSPEFDAIYNRFDGEKRILRALHIVTGNRYAKATIRGCCQGDWQEVYYPAAHYTPEDLRVLEAEYFNTGTEWIIHEGPDDPDGPEDIDGYSVYCIAGDDSGIRQEIADVAGGSPEDVTLYKFDGYSNIANYTEV